MWGWGRGKPIKIRYGLPSGPRSSGMNGGNVMGVFRWVSTYMQGLPRGDSANSISPWAIVALLVVTRSTEAAQKAAPVGVGGMRSVEVAHKERAEYQGVSNQTGQRRASLRSRGEADRLANLQPMPCRPVGIRSMYGSWRQTGSIRGTTEMMQQDPGRSKGAKGMSANPRRD